MKNRTPLLAAPLFALAALCGCSSHPTATSAGTPAPRPAAAQAKLAAAKSAAAFCAFLNKVNADASGATSANGLRTLKSLEPQITAQLKSAPSPIHADFATVAQAASNAVRQGTLAPLATNQVAQAGQKLSDYCKYYGR